MKKKTHQQQQQSHMGSSSGGGGNGMNPHHHHRKPPTHPHSNNHSHHHRNGINNNNNNNHHHNINNNNNNNNGRTKPSHSNSKASSSSSSIHQQQQQPSTANSRSVPISSNSQTSTGPPTVPPSSVSTSTTNTNDTTPSSSSNVFIGDKPLEPYLNDLFSALVNGTKASNNLPSNQDFEFFSSHFPQFRGAMDESASSLRNTLSSFFGGQKMMNSALLEDDPEIMFESTVDLLDQYFENVDIALDEMELNSTESRGVGVNPSLTNGSLNSHATLSSSNTDPHMSLKSMSRPQLKWTDIDNSNRPFVPKLKTKPNAFVATLEQSLTVGSLDELDEKTRSFQTFEQSTLPPFPFRLGVGNGMGGEPVRESYPHPYLPELLSLEFMPSQYKPPEIITPFSKLEDSSCTWISTVDDLHRLASLLEAQDAFAIDLEQHSYRSFQGFVCLMQISTRNEDFLIDTIELREHMHILNSSFTHPKIVKVMHGSDCDILWLQRDFGIYVVNMFDTGQACRVLTLPGCSLAYLLKHYCGIEADKKYQLADWRVRPLPSEMVKYAREDTHYLLYIYDRLRQDMFFKPNLSSSITGVERMEEVLVRSRELCMRRYEKELFTETSYLSLINKFTRSVRNINEKVIRVLYKWRDTVARKDDESVRYVLPDHMILSIAEQAPTEVSKLLACCNPVPKLVRRDAKVIVNLVSKTLNDESNDLTEPSFSTPSKIPEDHFINQHAKPSFELESPIFNPHYKTPSRMSPVMNTDDLYNIAGWIESKNYYPSSSISKLSFSEEDHEALDSLPFEPPQLVPHQNQRSVNVTPSKSSLFFPSSMSFPSLHNQEKVSKIMSSFSSFGSSQKQHSSHQNDVSMMSLDDSDMLFMPSTRSTTSSSNTIHHQQQMDQMDTTSSFLLNHHPSMSMMNDPNTTASTPNQSSKKPPASVRITPEEERVPSSLNEIYMLSQKNRKKNKQCKKKKLKQDSVSDPSPAFVGEGGEVAVTDANGEEASSDASQLNRAADMTASMPLAQKPVDFMKKIGWLGAEEELSASEEEKEEQEVNASVQVKVPSFSKPNMNVRKKPSKNYMFSKQNKY
ncbi:hypothetical protein FDP41_004936 [Naegleria fowleri]|uniref:HRDC domain-containing protein n=1 Tax=Naegleria fowleri TaxID=5763 RepID=A0A6A5BPU5_NAEFO|nr:uncharacterized protein FDP41_004936 [Naegleria fowleri]KAF0976261.1 hypothetical protein FDP41_004936 [Naegleria fowleri]